MYIYIYIYIYLYMYVYTHTCCTELKWLWHTWIVRGDEERLLQGCS